MVMSCDEHQRLCLKDKGRKAFQRGHGRSRFGRNREGLLE